MIDKTSENAAFPGLAFVSLMHMGAHPLPGVTVLGTRAGAKAGQGRARSPDRGLPRNKK